jgi:hypothetical protein
MHETINLKGNESSDDGEFARPPRRWRRGRIAGWAIAIIAFIGLGMWIVNGATQWKAVFLTNNQVYFGHFWDVPFEGTITLRNVYYLEFSSPSQQLDVQSNTQLKLVKLGSEIHGPTDEMVIPISQVLFWETLRPDSAIVTTIKNGQNASPATP